jgi:multiple sugar transport system permease protein
MATKRLLPPPAAVGFLLPNFLGFLAFVLFPVGLSFVMAFTNWTLKPAVPFNVVGLRNFRDLLGFRPVNAGDLGVAWGYVLAVVALLAGVVSALWANLSNWRGLKTTGLLLMLIGTAAVVGGVARQGIGTVYVGAVALVCGAVAAAREDATWRFGAGWAPGVLIALGAAGLTCMGGRMWATHELTDPRFWKYFYNTVFLMGAIPLKIAGALGLALLVNHRLPVGSGRRRIALAALLAVSGLVSAAVLAGCGFADAALLAGLFWFIAILAVLWNVVAFRTIFYLPTFTAGVALMILWKALYRPEGPINTVLGGLFSGLGLGIEAPNWLGSVAWAKPALIIMGLWIAIGGTTMLLYLAALSNVPQELLEAADVDGAGRWARFRYVIWPQLAPTTFFITVMSVIGGFQGGFQQARVMTGGGPDGATTTLSYYIYTKAFLDLDLGYAAAVSWVLFGIIFLATALNWRFGKGTEVDI